MWLLTAARALFGDRDLAEKLIGRTIERHFLAWLD